MKKLIWLLAMVALIVSVYAEDEIVVERTEFKHWNQFRGPNGNGQVMGKELPIEQLKEAELIQTENGNIKVNIVTNTIKMFHDTNLLFSIFDFII